MQINHFISVLLLRCNTYNLCKHTYYINLHSLANLLFGIFTSQVQVVRYNVIFLLNCQARTRILAVIKCSNSTHQDVGDCSTLSSCRQPPLLFHHPCNIETSTLCTYESMREQRRCVSHAIVKFQDPAAARGLGKKSENDEIAEPHNFFDSICFNSCLTYSFSFIHNKTMCTRRWVLDLSLCIIYERIMGRGNR